MLSVVGSFVENITVDVCHETILFVFFYTVAMSLKLVLLYAMLPFVLYQCHK